MSDSSRRCVLIVVNVLFASSKKREQKNSVFSSLPTMPFIHILSFKTDYHVHVEDFCCIRQSSSQRTNPSRL